MEIYNRPAKGLLAYLANFVCETRPKENAAEQSAAFFVFCGTHDTVGLHFRLRDGSGDEKRPHDAGFSAWWSLRGCRRS
jgi:hypothetical protein